MILYTSVPYEHVFPTEQNQFDAQKTIPCQAGQLIVEQEGEGAYRIVRLISSNPHDFLKPEYAPGTLLNAELNI
ncbi:YlzJ-like family protein [Shouchella patagoniensis]|uniref:YlzJ-like family protein n=1 Tax=Shouchella patagoniensis TaxID=228576 RepID=UPI000994A01D|nr:YlzJ-like family protein [Shouchella patagoniensis]